MDATTRQAPIGIVIPAPNPTGSLHLGHALNLTIQDIMARWYRYRGTRVYWEGATDHGASSTEIVMHRSVLENALTLMDLSDSAKQWMLARIVQSNTETIRRQFRDLRLTLDIQSMRTMGDPEVQREFDDYVRTLFDRGYLYWAVKIDDWCYERGQSIPAFDAVSSKSWRRVHAVQYCIEGTTFTIDHAELIYLIDEIGILVPAQSDLARFDGRFAVNPLGTKVPVYAANVSQCVSLRPAYDEASLKFCLQRDFGWFTSIGCYGIVEAGEFAGQDFRKACQSLYEIFQRQGTLRGSREESEVVRTCRGTGFRTYRRAVPGLFVRSSILLEHGMQEISSGKVSIFPRHYKSDLLLWMEAVLMRGSESDWRLTREHLCGSRVDPDLVAQACPPRWRSECQGTTYRMDMMISCALWSYSANGKYFPQASIKEATLSNGICVTGQDLLLFWIAPIVSLSAGVGRQVPFTDVIVHPLITDKMGRKMSKSMGNTIELDDVIQRFGAPALRLYLLAQCDERHNLLRIDVDELGAFLASLNQAIRERRRLGDAGSEQTCAPPDDVVTDLARIDQFMLNRDVGSAARIITSWVTSGRLCKPLPEDIARQARSAMDIFLAESQIFSSCENTEVLQ